MANKAWYGFDLDGTLAKFSNFKPEAIGAPIPPMVATLQRLVEQGKCIKIFTARVNSGLPKEVRESNRIAIEDWCKTHLGKTFEITAEKDYALIEFYDDRAVSVEFNIGRIKTFEIEK